MENQLQAERKVLRAKYDDSKLCFKLKQADDKILHREEKKTAKYQGRTTEVKNRLREEKAKVQKEIQRNRALINNIKDMHTEILGLEHKIEWVTGIIKKKRAAGLTMEDSKR